MQCYYSQVCSGRVPELLQMTTYQPTFLENKVYAVPLSKHKIVLSFPWESLNLFTNIHYIGKRQSYRQNAEAQLQQVLGGVRFKHCICYNQKPGGKSRAVTTSATMASSSCSILCLCRMTKVSFNQYLYAVFIY